MFDSHRPSKRRHTDPTMSIRRSRQSKRSLSTCSGSPVEAGGQRYADMGLLGDLKAGYPGHGVMMPGRAPNSQKIPSGRARATAWTARFASYVGPYSRPIRSAVLWSSGKNFIIMLKQPNSQIAIIMIRRPDDHKCVPTALRLSTSRRQIQGRRSATSLLQISSRADLYTAGALRPPAILRGAPNRTSVRPSTSRQFSNTADRVALSGDQVA